MLRLFRRPSRDNFELDPEAAPAADDNQLGTDAEGEPATGRKRLALKTILASGILAVGLGALYLGWSGSRSDEPVSLRLLPQGRPPLTQGALTPPVANAPTPPSSTAPAPPPGPVASPGEQAPAPTFYLPLQRDSREAAPGAAGQETDVPGGGAYNVLAEISQEATVENLRTQIAELKLKKLKAELEAHELRKNPKRLFKEEKAPTEPKREPSPLARLSPALPIPGPEPIPTQPQAQGQPEQPVAPAAPPQMRVRMVTLEPKEALIEAGDGDSRGWFKVHEGQKFPDFVVTTIGEDGVTIFFAGRGFFYPVGGYALGAPQDNRQGASRQASELPRR